MLRTLTIILLFGGYPAFAMSQEHGDGADAKRGMQAFVEAKSYAWTSEEAPGAGVVPVVARYEKRKPLYVVADKLECYRQGNQVAYLGDQGWMRSRTGTLSDPLRILGSVAKVRSLTMPHEELTILLGSDLKEKRNSRTKDAKQTKWVFALTGDAVRKLVPPQYAQVAQEGEAEVWAQADKLVRYRIEIGLKGTIGNAEIDGKYTHQVNVDAIGRTIVTPPEAAMRQLEPMP
ncbi:MAG: hypothetical protein U0744_19835 [Gemmataceae bacterium]